jgi:hypothetical protein
MMSGSKLRGWVSLFAGILAFGGLMGVRDGLPFVWQRAAIAAIAAGILVIAISIWRKAQT